MLVMKYFKGMKTMDIAKEMNISAPAVSKQINKAINKMQQQARYEGLLSALALFMGAIDATHEGNHGLLDDRKEHSGRS